MPTESRSRPPGGTSRGRRAGWSRARGPSATTPLLREERGRPSPGARSRVWQHSWSRHPKAAIRRGNDGGTSSTKGTATTVLRKETRYRRAAGCRRPGQPRPGTTRRRARLSGARDSSPFGLPDRLGPPLGSPSHLHAPQAGPRSPWTRVRRRYTLSSRAAVKLELANRRVIQPACRLHHGARGSKKARSVWFQRHAWTTAAALSRWPVVQATTTSATEDTASCTRTRKR